MILKFISGYPESKRHALSTSTSHVILSKLMLTRTDEGVQPTYPSQLVLPRLGHPEFQNSDQHSLEKGRRWRKTT